MHIQVTFPLVAMYSHIDLFLVDPTPLPRSYVEWTHPPRNAGYIFIGRISPYSGASLFAHQRMDYAITPFIQTDGWRLKLNSQSSLEEVARLFAYKVAGGQVLQAPVLQEVDECGTLVREIPLP